VTTGMAAVTDAVMSQVRAGDHIVASRALFGGCRFVVEDFMPRFGVSSTLVDGRDPANFAAAMQPNTKVVFIETPTNPTLELVDIKAVADIAHAHGAVLIVDNVFATALWQKPLALGADLVTYSATKHIDGQGRVLGGIVLGSKKLIEGDLHTFLRQTGASLSPFNAWVMLKGMETMDLRIDKMCSNAAKVADGLFDLGAFKSVNYPGRSDFRQHELAMKQMTAGGSVVTVFVPEGREQAFKFLNALEVTDISNNIGDAKSLMTHPASTTHKSVEESARLEMGITEGMLRLSVGLENADDLLEDFARAAKIAGL